MRRRALLAFTCLTWIAAAPAAAQETAATAEKLEAAYAETKVAKNLFSAAKLRQKSNEPAKAANDYAAYLAFAPEKETKTRLTAQKELAVLAAKLGRFAIRATGSTKLAVDGETVDATFSESWYVMPGPHSVEATFGTVVAKEQGTAIAGESVPVVIAAPPEADAAPAPAVPKSAAAPPKAAQSSEKFSLPPLAVYIGGGLTVLLGALTVMSALDVASQKDKFDAERSQDNLDDGKSKQTRTNILLGITGGVALLTGVMAIALVDWKRTDTKLGVGPGTLLLEGTF